jgi:peptidyl-prolyl cis-trans isomerase SurA
MSNRFVIMLSFCFLFFASMGQNGDPVLMRVGKSDVKVSEFKYIYEKNNGQGADYSQKSLNEYLDLYTKFKLKVEKAKQLQLDTISALVSELDGYRKQLASSYLIDKEVTDFLLQELYARTKEDVEFSHIFIPMAESATKTQREETKSKLREVKAKLVAGTSFEAAAKEFSQDKTTSDKGGNMGYFTAKLPSGFYELESALYNTPKGQVSDIVTSKIGYHLVKVTNKRPARGTLEVAHILVAPEQAKLADSIYQAVKSGIDFDKLALKYSIDKATMKNGGKLPPFGINTYDRVFEDAAFSLSANGEISTPVMTKSGWHIIKRINKMAPDTYDIFVRKMKSQINKDQRFDAAKLKLIDDIKKSAGFKEDKSELSKFTASLDDEFYSYKWSPDANVSNKMLFSLGGNKVFGINDFANFCKKNTKTRLKYDKSKPIAETIDELYIEFVNETAMAYEEQSLESKYPDFKSLMREYEEGILLFEATKINVWDRANQDTVGLKSFYETVKNNYNWPEKAKVVTYKISGVDKKTADKIYQFALKNEWAKMDKKFNKKTKVVEYTESEIDKDSKEATGLKWGLGGTSTLNTDAKGSSYTFQKINSIIPSRGKTLSEARGYVVADYQDFLEKEWMQTLKKEFDVTIFQDVLSSLKK